MIKSLGTLDFASRLWGVFRALIGGALVELKVHYGEGVTEYACPELVEGLSNKSQLDLDESNT